MTTPAQRRASNKFIKEKWEQIVFKKPKGTKARWKAAAEKAGMSFAGFIVNAVEEYIKNNNLEPSAEEIAKCDDSAEPAVTKSTEPVQSEVKQPELVKKTSSVFKKIRERENGSK